MQRLRCNAVIQQIITIRDKALDRDPLPTSVALPTQTPVSAPASYDRSAQHTMRKQSPSSVPLAVLLPPTRSTCLARNTAKLSNLSPTQAQPTEHLPNNLGKFASNYKSKLTPQAFYTLIRWTQGQCKLRQAQRPLDIPCRMHPTTKSARPTHL